MKKKVALFVLFLLWMLPIWFFAGSIVAIEAGSVGLVKFFFYNFIIVLLGVTIGLIFREDQRW